MPSLRRRPRSGKHASVSAPIAPLYTEFTLFTRAEAFIAETRMRLAQATTAPNAFRREAGFHDVWIYTNIAGEKLDELPCMTTALQCRRADLRRQLEAIQAEAAQAAFGLSQHENRGNVIDVDFTARRRVAQ